MKKRRIIISLMILCILVGTCSCGKGSDSPTEVVSAFLEAYKAQDTEKMAQYYSGDINTVFHTTADEVLNTSNIMDFNEKLLSFEYRTTKENITQNSATVEVNLTTYNFESVFYDSFSEYISLVSSSMFSNSTEEDMTNKFDEILTAKLTAATFDYKKTVTVNLTKGETGWMIDPFDSESPFANAITGGLVDLLKSLTQSFGSNSGTNSGSDSGTNSNS